MAKCEQCNETCPANDRTFTDGGGIVCTDCRCSVCGGWHGQCKTEGCNNTVGCDPEEPGESWIYCDQCDADMKGGASC